MTSVAALPAPGTRRRAAYENWRPPIVGVSVLAIVRNGRLLLLQLHDGSYVLPTANVEDGQSPEEAAQGALAGLVPGLPVQRQVVVDRVQMRRRRVFSHVVVTEALTAPEVRALTFRDPRADVQVLPTTRALAVLPPGAQLRAVLGLQAASIGAVLHLNDGQIARVEDVRPRSARSRTSGGR
ncbi:MULTISPECIES: NUDIX hydrolase [Streptomyces]|uniref:hypothetical protein n=1 Tax=Streptomyces TaxID=1883 RepID=UPI001021C384|nr:MULTISPECIES: hypothetical protein [Streptomyces]RZF06979.1 hypothetical protein C0R05_19030 [Streptomyces albidoflavus]